MRQTADKLEDEALFAEFTASRANRRLLRNREYNKAIREIMALTDKTNKYIDEKALGNCKRRRQRGRIASRMFNGY